MLKIVRFFQRQLIVLLVPLAIAILNGCSCNNCAVPAFRPTPSGGVTPPGVISCTASGTGAIGVLCFSGKTYAFVGKGSFRATSPTNTVEQVDISSGAAAAVRTRASKARQILLLGRANASFGHARAAFHRYAAFHTYALDFAPTECSSDETHKRVFCGGFNSSKIADIDASATTNSEFDTLATGSLSFTGGTCTVCAIAYDPKDNAFIMLEHDATTTGKFVSWGEDSHATITTIADSDPNENPGYDYTKNWIFTPQYQAANPFYNIADFNTGTFYTSSTPVTTSSTILLNALPLDSATVDVATHVALAPMEFPTTGNTYDVFTADLGTAVLNSPAAGMFTLTTADRSITSSAISNCGASLTDTATDSVLHVTFITEEFCGPGTGASAPSMGFVLLPTTGSGVPSISDYAFVQVPNTPDGMGWESGFDPHPITAFNDPVNCRDCAILVDGHFTWLGVVDLNKLIHVPRSATDPHSIAPSYDLQANGVLKYYAI
jgi:hypothetical protein